MKKINYLPLAAVAAGVAVLAKKKSSVSGVGGLGTSGYVYYNGRMLNLRTASLEDVCGYVSECTDQNDHWTAREAIALWCAFQSKTDDNYLKYYDLMKAFSFLEHFSEQNGGLTDELQKVRIAISQVLFNCISQDFGKSIDDKLWSAL